MNPIYTRDVEIPAGRVRLAGMLNTSEQADAVVVFAHGSGSSRHSTRNQQVARALNEAGFATLLFDLMTEEEEQFDRLSLGDLRFDVGLLAERLIAATAWLVQSQEGRTAAVGYFGASTGAAAALIAAAELPRIVRAVVSRGGRPDMAASALPAVQTPTLLIVGGNDAEVVKLNEEAYEQLIAEKDLIIVPGAGHLFEEAGALQSVSELARDWFAKYLLWSDHSRASTAS